MSGSKMHSDELDIDVALVRRLLTTQFPHWADLSIEPVASSGTVNALYRLGDGMVARLPRVQRWAGDIDKELRWLPRLASQLPLAIPEPIAKGCPGDGYPWQRAIYRWLEGETWATERVRDLSENAVALARFIIALQRIDTAGAPEIPRRYDALAAQDPYVRPAIAGSRGVVDVEALSAAWNVALELPAWDGPPVWVHADLGAGNLLVAEGRLSAVIDFGGVNVGDPAHDLVVAWSLFSRASRESFRAALSVDAATWARARGWALRCVIAIPYYKDTNPEMVAEARHIIGEVLADSDDRA